MKRIYLMGIWLVCVVAGALASIQMLWSILVNSPKAWRLAKAFDRVANAATGGQDTETISSRAHRAVTEKRRWGCILCRFLDHFEKDHCKKSSGV